LAGRRVAFLGPRGTFTEEALRASAPESIEEVPYPSIYETIMAVHDGEAELGIVPIENSLEGAVTTTLDLLADEVTDVRIVAEVVFGVQHLLVGREAVELERIERVLSHPQATAQCARFLRERLPGAQRAAAGSTAEAVRTVVEGGDSAAAALGSRLAAELYGGVVLAEGVEDHPDNQTRFVWLASGEAGGFAEPNKTSIVFWGFNDVSPGALVDVLRELSSRGINLTKIESRPRRMSLGHYMFFADLEGSASEPHVDEALRALAGRVEVMRVLGSYPAGST
jgi:prephenate dehydratase